MAPVTGQAHVATTLAVLCIAGGVLGYLKKGSTASLIAGVGVGAGYAASAYLIQNVDAFKGHALAAGTSALLATAMGMRFAKTGKFMPAGLMTGVGVAALTYHGFKVQEWA